MEIKTIKNRLDNPAEFDKAVNAALADGWVLTRREILLPHQPSGDTYFHMMLYAELVKPDGPKPVPEPETTWQQAVKVLHDICEDTCRNNCEVDCSNCRCPIKSWCDQAIPPEGKRPEVWELDL